MKKSAKTIIAFILLATLCATSLLLLSGCGVFCVLIISSERAVVDGVHYSLNTRNDEATVLYFDADKSLAKGELQICTIPEKITHWGTEYTVTAIESDYVDNVNIINGNTSIGELIIPKTVSFVYLYDYVDIDSLQKITVDEDNPYFYSKDGVLFNRYSFGLTLRYYPVGKTDTTFELPSQFGEEGLEYWSYIWRNEYLQNLEIEEGNTLYTSINGVLYSHDGKTLMLYSVNKTDETFVAPKGMKNISLNSGLWNNANIKKVQVEDGSSYLKAENNVLYSLDGSELVFRPNDGSKAFAIPSSVKVVSYNALQGLEYLYVPESVVVFLDTFVGLDYFNLSNINHIYFESDVLPKYLRGVFFFDEQLHFGVARESFDLLVDIM